MSDPSLEYFASLHVPKQQHLATIALQKLHCTSIAQLHIYTWVAHLQQEQRQHTCWSALTCYRYFSPECNMWFIWMVAVWCLLLWWQERLKWFWLKKTATLSSTLNTSWVSAFLHCFSRTQTFARFKDAKRDLVEVDALHQEGLERVQDVQGCGAAPI